MNNKGTDYLTGTGSFLGRGTGTFLGKKEPVPEKVPVPFFIQINYDNIFFKIRKVSFIEIRKVFLHFSLKSADT
jgi:hypothetical protein